MKASLSVLCISLAASTFAYGSQYGMPVEQSDIEDAISKTLFPKMDTNKDGKISFDEIFQYRAAEDKKQSEKRANILLSQCDKNKDGKIAKSELMQLTMDEYKPVPYRPDRAERGCPVPVDVLEVLDIDGDGFITKKEIIDASTTRSRPSKKMREKMEKRGNKQRAKHEKMRFERCDQDKDKFLTLREAASMKCHIYTEMFDAKDKDGDSLLSLDEMMAEAKIPGFGEHDDMALPSELIERDLPPEVMIDMRMSSCDENDNGKLELTETNAKKCAVDLVLFNSIDINADGAIDEQEQRRMRMKTSFDEMDKNGDGFLDKSEFKGSQVRYL